LLPDLTPEQGQANFDGPAWSFPMGRATVPKPIGSTRVVVAAITLAGDDR
jgi:hypothetical protein